MRHHQLEHIIHFWFLHRQTAHLGLASPPYEIRSDLDIHIYFAPRTGKSHLNFCRFFHTKLAPMNWLPQFGVVCITPSDIFFVEARRDSSGFFFTYTHNVRIVYRFY
jgi:hypothetical protein